MYISPNSDVEFFKSAPFSPDHTHTVGFIGIQSQGAYFNTFQPKLMFGNQYYQRVTKDRIRIQHSADLLKEYNYMRFRNTAFSNKWFYAFVLEVEYINNTVCEVHYAIDVIQTYLFDITLLPCFVEREHSSTDAPGDNIVDEGIEVGEYVFNEYKSIINNPWMDVMVGAIEEGSTNYGAVYDGVYHGDYITCFHIANTGGIDALNAYLASFRTTPENVTQLYTIPREFVPNDGSPAWYPGNSTVAPARDYTLGSDGHIPNPEPSALEKNGLDGYIPKNNKLFTYPYNFLHIDNANGSELNLRYEFFSTPVANVNLSCTITQPVTVKLVPRFYKNSLYNESETLSLSGYPVCSWSSDSYYAWVAQNSSIENNAFRFQGLANFAITAGQLATGVGATSAFVGTAVRGATSILNDVHNMIDNRTKASFATDVCRGTANSNINCASGTQNFYYGRCSINAQNAQIIDSYFDRFGYAVKRIKQPVFNARPEWNYIKTKGCELTASIPGDAYREICDIFDNGITFWKNPLHVGNFSLDNRLV